MNGANNKRRDNSGRAKTREVPIGSRRECSSLRDPTQPPSFLTQASFYLTLPLHSRCLQSRFVFLTLYTLTSVCIFSLLFLYISKGSEKKNLFKNQEFPALLIISIILMTLMFYSGMIL